MFTVVLWKSAIIGQSRFYYIPILTALLVTLSITINRECGI